MEDTLENAPLAEPQLEELSRHRFEEKDRAAKEGVWRVLCSDYFSKIIREQDTVLDVAAGYCEFINNVKAQRRIAVDANPDLVRFAGPGVEVSNSNVERMDFLPSNSVDVAFTSNFFEHLPDKGTLMRVVREIHRVLRPGGSLIVMGPNVKYLAGKYWDFFDHHLPLTEVSVQELLHLVGFEAQRALPKFLPYTVKSRLPTWPWLVKAYLLLGPISFPIFGRQFLVISTKR